MAKYEVKCCKCGKELEVELFGKHVDRESKLAWMAENYMCTECYREHQKETKPNILLEGLDEILYVYSPISYDIKEELKELGYRWDRNKDMWSMPLPKANDSEIAKWLIDRVEELAKHNFRYAYVDYRGRNVELTIDDLKADIKD